MVNLLAVHIASRYGANECLTVSLAKRVNEKDVSPCHRSPDGSRPVFAVRMVWVLQDHHYPVENAFDLFERQAMFKAFLLVASIPVKAINRLLHGTDYGHLYIQLSTMRRDKRIQLQLGQSRKTTGGEIAGRRSLEKRIRIARGRTQSRERKSETRRDLLVGIMIRSRVKENPETEPALLEDLDAFLEHPRDRALFGLAPTEVSE